MPKVSRDSVADVLDMGPVVDRHSDIDGYTFSFITFNVDTDGTELVKGLPDDQCQCPHWGYVFQGRLGFRFSDHDEWFESGDAFYVPAGHIPLSDADADALLISPADLLRTTEEAMQRNLQKLQGA